MSKTTSGPTTAVTLGVASSTILATNVGRREVTIVNDDATNVVYLGFGRAATLNNGVRLNAAGGSFSTTNWEGTITGISAAGTPVVTVTEF